MSDEFEFFNNDRNIEREREGERESTQFRCVCVCVLYKIHTYIESEREREREREREYTLERHAVDDMGLHVYRGHQPRPGLPPHRRIRPQRVGHALRLERARQRLRPPLQCPHHPRPGSCPIVRPWPPCARSRCARAQRRPPPWRRCRPAPAARRSRDACGAASRPAAGAPARPRAPAPLTSRPPSDALSPQTPPPHRLAWTAGAWSTAGFVFLPVLLAFSCAWYQ